MEVGVQRRARDSVPPKVSKSCTKSLKVAASDEVALAKMSVEAICEDVDAGIVLLVHLGYVCVWGDARQAFEKASEEAMAGKMVDCTDVLDRLGMSEKGVLDGEECVSVDGFGSRHSDVFVRDGGEVFGCDMELLCIELHGTFVAMMAFEQNEKLVEYVD